jgi:hypothetical protein
MNKKIIKRNKNLLRSEYSGKIINGKGAILVEEVEEYLIKKGYKIISPEMKIAVFSLSITFIMLGSYLIL